MKSLKKGFLFATLGLLSCMCLIGYFYIKWDKVGIDEGLKKNITYTTFKEELNEIPQTTNLETESIFSPYKCSIYDHKYYLEINFRIGDGFSGGGYNIDVVKNRYKISEYSYTDHPSSSKPEKSMKVIKSELKLDKSTYTKGEYAYGYLDFKIQHKYGSETYIDEGRGYFKAIVK